MAFETDTSSIGEVICERAADTGAAAVVMASHGKGRFRELFIGSVTNYCLHRWVHSYTHHSSHLITPQHTSTTHLNTHLNSHVPPTD